jgi:hypothetical protein
MLLEIVVVGMESCVYSNPGFEPGIPLESFDTCVCMIPFPITGAGGNRTPKSSLHAAMMLSYLATAP